MGRRKKTAAVLALVFSLFSLPTVYAAEEKGAEKQPRYVKYEKIAENAEELYGEYIPVLMYHHFAERDMGIGNGVVTSAKELEDHLKYFRSEGWRIISLEELDRVLERAESRKLAKKDPSMGLGLDIKYLCITMDDGYYSNYEFGYPLFEKYRASASVFAVTDYITEQTGIRKFTWKQAQEMEESGWVKVYSHSSDHVPVEKGQEDAFLASMQKSEKALEENLKGAHVKAMAYPNGRYTEKVQQLMDEEGYKLQFTIEKGVITGQTKRNAIPRITVESGMDGRDVIREIELAAEKTFAAEREGNVT